MQDKSTDLLPGIYLHFKGREYEVLGIVMSASDESLWVHYKALYDTGKPFTWIRPLAEFTEPVRWPDGEIRPRFNRKLKEV